MQGDPEQTALGAEVDCQVQDRALNSTTRDTLDPAGVLLQNQQVAGANLTLVKQVVNNSGGTAAPSAWTLTASGLTPISGTSGSAAVNR